MVIPKVKVAVTNVSIGLARTTMTDNSGDYSVAALNPGEYMISAEYQGFKTELLRGIVLEVNQIPGLETLSPTFSEATD